MKGVAGGRLRGGIRVAWIRRGALAVLAAAVGLIPGLGAPWWLVSPLLLAILLPADLLLGRLPGGDPAPPGPAERLPASTQEGYRELFDNAGDIVYIHDLEGRFLTVNRAAEQVTGYRRDDILAMSISDILPQTSLERAREMIARKIRGEETRTRYELEVRHRDGRTILMEVNTRVIYRDGRPAAVQGIARDVTSRSRHEEALRAFIANAAHELRTPLTTLAGVVQTLAANRARMSEQEQEDAFASLARQGQRVRRLVDNLLDLSWIEHGAEEMERRPVLLSAALRRAIQVVRPPEDRLLRIQVPGELAVTADPMRLDQVLINLLSNAVHYGGPTITFVASEEAGWVTLVAADDGEGVPEEAAEGIFDPFARGPAARGNVTGSGLGLAICRRLVEAFGGSIAYEPGEPRGSRFVVRLPAGEAPAAEGRADPAEAAPPEGRR